MVVIQKKKRTVEKIIDMLREGPLAKKKGGDS